SSAHCPPTLSRISTRCALISSRPSSNTANRPTGPAPMIRTSVLIVSLITLPGSAGSLFFKFPFFGATAVVRFSGLSCRPLSYATIGNFDQTQQFRQILLRCAAARRKGNFSLCVERLAAAQDRYQVLHGSRAVRHRAHVALRHHAAHVLIRVGLDPYREAGGEQ